jgi:hypothetical protein
MGSKVMAAAAFPLVFVGIGGDGVSFHASPPPIIGKQQW